jgi:uncharacterized protein YjbI with pentapeptide repeats|tara:strand:+ start:3631 stop:3984 length:354 start_codon:yes stop_codon:yes gene_type:complete
MDLKMIGLYGLAGLGAYALYEKMTTENTSAFQGTDWQRSGLRGTDWQNANTNFAGTEWQQEGRNRETMWQEGNVFSNACGGYNNANGTPAPGSRRANLQGTDWQTANMSNACGSCGA